jgi:dephospho-CoA kinase
MPCLVGVAGLAGAGKTTAVQYLSALAGGRIVYLGDVVLQEIRARGLPETRENERRVRVELRQQNSAEFALRNVDVVSRALASQMSVFVDAIFVQTEFEVLKSCAGDASTHLLAIEASFDVRCARLLRREDRPLTQDELQARDKLELESLNTGTVLSGASHAIRNEGSIENFYTQLADFLRSCSDVAERSA